MRIITIGTSPYVLNSMGRLHSYIIKCLASSADYQCASLVSSHDSFLYFPEQTSDNNKTYFYNFTTDKEYKVPVFPYSSDPKSSTIQIYEYLKALQPDVVVTIGPIEDFYFMDAILTFATSSFKWFAVLANNSATFSTDYKTLAKKIDGCLCTNAYTLTNFQQVSSVTSDYCYVGCDLDVFKQTNKSIAKRIFSRCSNNFKDSPPLIANFVAGTGSGTRVQAGTSLYLHTETDGLYDLPQFINTAYTKLPTVPISQSSGLSDQEYAKKLNDSDVFLTGSICSSTSISIFEALACGCVPVYPKSLCDVEVINSLKVDLPILANTGMDVQVVYVGNNKIFYMPIRGSAITALKTALSLNSDAINTFRTSCIKIANKLSNKNFLQKFVDMIKEVVKKDPIIHLA